MADRILIVSPTDSRSGAGLFRHALAMELRQAGYDIILAQPGEDGPIQAEETARGIEHHFFSRNPYDDIAAFAQDQALAADEINRSAPDFVVFSSGVSPECHFPFLEAVEQARIPYLLIEHQVAPGHFAANPRTVARFSTFYRNASAVVAVSENNLRYLRQSLALPDQVGRVIRYGRPDAFFRQRDAATRAALRREWGVPDGAIVALTVAKLEPVKGHRFLIETIRQLKIDPIWDALYFVWIGDGMSRAKLELDIAESGVGDRVRLPGHHHDVAPLYDGGDIFVLTSESEGMPLAVMEAMAKGLPPICTDVGGTAEAIGDAGIVLPEPTEDGRTVSALASALRSLTDDRDRLGFLSKRARQRAAALFRVDRMIEEYRDLIARCLAASRATRGPKSTPVATVLPEGDYIAPVLVRIRLDDSFPNMMSTQS
jgi:glycosyltransferase involved in cell wall biosynthesis